MGKPNANVTALILAGGFGNRWIGSVESEWFAPKLGVDRDLVATLRGTPKVVTPICGIPIAVRKMMALADDGVTDFVVRLGFHGKRVRELVAAHADPSWQMTFVESTRGDFLLRDVVSLLMARGGDCIACNADTLADIDYCAFFRAHRDCESLITVAEGPDGVSAGDVVLSSRLLNKDLRPFHRLGEEWDQSFCAACYKYAEPYAVGDYVNMNTLKLYHVLMTDIAAGKKAWILGRERGLEMAADSFALDVPVQPDRERPRQPGVIQLNP